MIKNSGVGWIAKNGRKYLMIDGRCVLEYRVIMEKHLGRSLERDEVIHHINKDILDNRIENLQLMRNGQHVSFHGTGKIRKGQLTEQGRKSKSDKMKQAWKNGAFDKAIWTAERRKNCSDMQKEMWRTGKHKRHHSTETRQKMSDSHKRVWDDDRKAKYAEMTQKRWADGKYIVRKSSEASRLKCSETMKRRWAEGIFENRDKGYTHRKALQE